jgi:hypothetical protein
VVGEAVVEGAPRRKGIERRIEGADLEVTVRRRRRETELAREPRSERRVRRRAKLQPDGRGPFEGAAHSFQKVSDVTRALNPELEVHEKSAVASEPEDGVAARRAARA